MVTLPNSSTVFYAKKVALTYGTVSPISAATAIIERAPPAFVLCLVDP